MKFRSIPQVKNSVVSSLAVFLLTLPIVCAAQEKIIFTSNRSGNGDIYSMKPDGTLPTQLTIDAAVDHEPSVSFDGSRIVFTSQRDFQSSDLEEIYIMNADGSNQTRLTNNFLKDFEPAISPDGTRIAFVQAPFQIFIMNADGTSPTALVPGFDPSFSSDGSKIIYSAFGSTSYEIFTINLDGTNRTQITQNASFDGHPKFSPDGRRIAFVSDRDGEAAVYIMNVDGTDQLRLASIFTDPFNTWGLSFSPDSSRVAFTALVAGNFDLYSIGSDGFNLLRLTDHPAADLQPSWSGPIYAPPVFEAPTELRADYIGANSVNLRWTDNSNIETGFIIEECRNKNCTNTVQLGQVGANITTFLDTPRLANTQYIYRVAAINAAGERTAYSNTLMVKTLRK